MRIAVSGTHDTGKSTPIQILVEKLAGYEAFEEPYLILEESGYDFSDPPTIEDFEKQLECSLSLIKESSDNLLFDRSPIDFLGYAIANSEGVFRNTLTATLVSPFAPASLQRPAHHDALSRTLLEAAAHVADSPQNRADLFSRFFGRQKYVSYLSQG